MRVYRVAWLIVCGSLAAVGIAVLAIISLAVLMTLFVVFALVGVTLVFADADESGNPYERVRPRRVLAGAMAAGTAAPAFVGLAAVLGPGVLLLVPVVAATAPSAMSLYARWLRAATTPPNMSIAAWAPGFVSPNPGVGTAAAASRPRSAEHRGTLSSMVRKLSGPERPWLAGAGRRRRWRRSQERQRYLDELERRNATGFTAWLASGARVASNPLPYLVETRNERPVINWEELI